MKNIQFSGRSVMMTLAALATIALLAQYDPSPTSAQTKKSNYVSPPGYITGTVTSEKGPEAGVWVIAETKALPTGFIKTVVTDDQGRFVIPELPGVTYKVWVRGYGLVDSTPMDLKPSPNQVALKVTTAKTPQEAAKVYPGDYWLSMLAPPPKNLFPGTGPQGNGVGTRMVSQDLWINSLKSDCNFCHQLGNALTRDVNHVFAAKSELKTHEDAWEWRLGVGVRGTNMYSVLTNQGKEPSLKAFADWTRAVADGQVPPAPHGRKGSNGISSRRNGTWATTTPSCTIRFRPTRTIRKSTAAGPTMR